MLKVTLTNLPFLTPGDSDKVRVGDVALAIGNPLDVGQTVTMEIISAKGRSTPGTGSGNFEDFSKRMRQLTGVTQVGHS